jgi:hypothetical protein
LVYRVAGKMSSIKCNTTLKSQKQCSLKVLSIAMMQ